MELVGVGDDTDEKQGGGRGGDEERWVGERVAGAMYNSLQIVCCYCM
uniref:Uncharacterized protein n=1 Tax=Arundo donax TaxID=35708 RepID=A0A0A8YDE2_ARUDO